MTVRTGSCLCGARAYEIEGELDGVWICHCSLCRKASGSNGNSILIVPRDRFRRSRLQLIVGFASEILRRLCRTPQAVNSSRSKVVNVGSPPPNDEPSNLGETT